MARFGGALDGAAEEFSKAFDKGLSPRDFVDTMRKENKLSKWIMEYIFVNNC